MLQREAAKAFGVLVLEVLVTLSRREVLREVLWRSFWKNNVEVAAEEVSCDPNVN